MVATYDRCGIRFLYPDNWKVQEDNPQPHAHCVTLQSPGSGFWMLQMLEPRESLDRLASDVLDSVQQEYEEVEIVPAGEDVEGTSLAGYDMQFYCLDFVVRAKVRSFSLADHACVLLFQAEDSEFEKIGLVFSAITASLIQEANRDST